MAILWDRGEVTAEEVRAALPGNPHDSTVRTILRVLESKGFVTHEVRDRRFVYRAAVERAAMQETAVGAFLDRFFGGSAKALLLRLVENEKLTLAQLDEIRKEARKKPRRRRPSR